MASPLRVLRTVRWLRTQQISGQLRRRLLGSYLPRAGALAPDSEPSCQWALPTDVAAPAPEVGSASALLAGRFEFLNEERELGWPPDWDAQGASRLWRYNLHYFEYLWSLDYPAAREGVDDWIERHPPTRTAVGWEPYPVSLRLMNWCAYFFGRERANTGTDAGFSRRLWASIRLQAGLLERDPETHLLGNHLFENAAALSLAGACFAGAEGERWLAQGLGILEAELAEQLLADGGHFERSPMYHARVVTVLDLLERTGNADLLRLVSEPLERARRALAAMAHPDGDIALLNDAAFGIVKSAGELEAGDPTPGPFALAQTGYYGARSGRHYVICDAAPIGPDYLPGHAHADIFSFELSLGGARAVVDSGVYDYVESELRAWCRSTRAHNTVEIEGEDQCELWGAFRVGRRGRPHDVSFTEREGGFLLSGWHDGYAHLPGQPRHERSFRWHPEGVLLVRDRVVAGRAVTARTSLQLHPDCVPEIDGHAVHVEHSGGAFRVGFAGPGELGVEDSRYCPGFGVRQAGRRLVFESHGAEQETGFCIAAGAESVVYDLRAGADVDGRRFDW